MQDSFALDCELSTEPPVYDLKDRLGSWLCRLSEAAEGPEREEARKKIQELETQIKLVKDEAAQAREVCERYKVKI